MPFFKCSVDKRASLFNHKNNTVTRKIFLAWSVLNLITLLSNAKHSVPKNMKQKKHYKIIHIMPRFYSPSYTFILNLIERLKRDANDNTVLTKDVLIGGRKDVHDISINSLSYIKKHVQRKVNAIRGLVSRVNYARAKLILEDFSPHVIHCHFGNSAQLMSSIEKYANHTYPQVVSLHGYDVFMHYKFERGYLRQMQALSNRKDVIFTVPSDFLKNKAVEQLGIAEKNIEIVPNSFNEKLFTHKFMMLDAQQELRIANVSRFVDWKGQKFLIRALAILNKYRRVHVDFVGEGVERFKCMRLAEELGVFKHCTFHGALSPDKVSDIVGRCHLYVHTAVTMKSGQTETFGIAILEAIAMGKPAIYFDVGGISEVFGRLESKYYIGVEEKNHTDLVKAILEIIPLLEKLDTDYLKKLCNEVTAMYSEDSYINKIYALYDRVTSAS